MTPPPPPVEPAARTSLRRRLTGVLVLVALGSIVLLGAVNYVEARMLLSDAVAAGLEVRGAGVAANVEDGIDGVRATTAVAARGEGLATALRQFADAFDALDRTRVSPAVRRAVSTYYESTVVDDLRAAGLDPPPAAALVPTSDAGVLLQFHYLVEPSDAVGDQDDPMAAYRDAHDEWDPQLAGLIETLGFARLLLVDAEGRVVYSTDPRPDLGTSLDRGPHRDTALARVVTERLATAPAGDALFADFEFYLPSGGQPTLFSVAALRRGGEFSGAVALEVPVAALNDLTGALGDAQELGLGRTGDTYIVGPDNLMRSESRRWVEDPEAYLSGLERTGDQDTVERLRAVDTTVLVQPVENAIVQDAFEGATTSGRTVDYLGRQTITFAMPVDPSGLDWVVVSQVDSREAREPLRTFQTRLLILAALLLPAAAALAFAIADRMTRPIVPLVDVARDIARGDLETPPPDLGANEYGDVARRLGDMAAHLRAQQESLAEEEEEMTRLLLAALPPRLVERVRSGERELEDLVDTATVVSVTVTGVFDTAGVEPEVAVEIGARLSGALEGVAATHGIERVRSSSARHLFVAGLGEADFAVDAGVAFAIAARDAVSSLADAEGLELGFHAGLAAGRVVSGLLTGRQLSYALFGDPVQLALTLDASATSHGEVLLHESVTSRLDERWTVESASGLVDLGGSEISASRLVSRRVP